jgi:single-strand DNA-binding protein
MIYTTETGKKVARFSLATVESYKDKNGDWVKQTSWHQVVAWGKAALMVEEKAKKGVEIAIEGKLQNRSYTNKEGHTAFVTEIEAKQLLLIYRNKNVEKTASNNVVELKQQRPF